MEDLVNLSNDFGDCKVAARFLEIYEEHLLRAQLSSLQEDVSGLLVDIRDREVFENNLKRCLDWVRVSLDFGDYYPTGELERALDKKYFYLYLKALKGLMASSVLVDLSESQKKYFRMFTQHLIEEIQS